MPLYYLSKNQQTQGPFEPEVVRSKLAAGEYAPTDLVWQDGWPGWRPIAQEFPDLPAASASAPPAPAAPPSMPPQPAPAAVAASPGGVPTCGQATASLVCGILALAIFGILAGIPAIFLGHSARRKIRQSQGRLGGDGMALAGLILGYVATAVTLVVIPIIILGVVAAATAAH